MNAKEISWRHSEHVYFLGGRALGMKHKRGLSHTATSAHGQIFAQREEKIKKFVRPLAKIIDLQSFFLVINQHHSLDL